MYAFKTLLAAALLFGSAAAVQPSTASAQSSPAGPSVSGPMEAYAQYRGRYYYRAGGPRFYGYGGRSLDYRLRRDDWPGLRSHGPYYHYGYARPYRYGYYRPYRYGYYRPYYHRHYSGGALAAGLIGGLALGTLAHPYYYPPYPYYYGPASFGHRCVFERRRVINHYGHRVWRRVQVCY